MNDANLSSIDGADERKSKTPRVVIVGGGFGGLAAAKALGKAPVEVILIDRTNHHVFQPLLYQVATSVLAPSQMSSPIREVLRRHKNTTVIMGEVTGVDKVQRCVFVNDADREHVPVRYDYLILATGARHSYFGHNGFEKPGRCRRYSKQNPQRLRAGRGRRKCRSSPRFIDVRFGRGRTNRRRDGGGARYFHSNVITFRIPPDRSDFSTNCFDRCRPKRSWDFCTEPV